MSGLPSLGFPPSSRCQPAESTESSLPSPTRSVLDVSHVLDGFLLHRPSRVYFAPQPRPGFALQGFSLSRSRTSSSLAVALLSFARGPCSRLPGRSRFSRSPSGLCSSRQSVARTRRFRSRAARSPPELHPPSGFPSDTVGRPSSPFRPQPFTALVVLPVPNLTCSCEPAFPVRGSWPAPPPRLPPLLWYETASSKRSASTAHRCYVRISLRAPYQLWWFCNSLKSDTHMYPLIVQKLITSVNNLRGVCVTSDSAHAFSLR